MNFENIVSSERSHPQMATLWDSISVKPPKQTGNRGRMQAVVDLSWWRGGNGYRVSM